MVRRNRNTFLKLILVRNRQDTMLAVDRLIAAKCIWALGEIRTVEAKEKLKLLTQSNNKIIKENALMQLERIYL